MGEWSDFKKYGYPDVFKEMNEDRARQKANEKGDWEQIKEAWKQMKKEKNEQKEGTENAEKARENWWG